MSPLQTRAREVWENSVAPHFLAVMAELAPDLAAESPAMRAALRHLKVNFEAEIARALRDLAGEIVVETFDRPRAGARD